MDCLSFVGRIINGDAEKLEIFPDYLGAMVSVLGMAAYIIFSVLRDLCISELDMPEQLLLGFHIIPGKEF